MCDGFETLDRLLRSPVLGLDLEDARLAPVLVGVIDDVGDDRLFLFSRECHEIYYTYTGIYTFRYTDILKWTWGIATSMPCMLYKSGRCSMCDGVSFFPPDCPANGIAGKEAPGDEEGSGFKVRCPQCGFEYEPVLPEDDDGEEYP